MAGSVKETLLGELAIRARFITRAELDECLDMQRRYPSSPEKPAPRIGAILAHKGYLTREQVQALLSGRYNRQKGRFGEIAVRLGLVESELLDEKLAAQAEAAGRNEKTPRIGQLLLDAGAIKSHHVHAILRAQGKTVVDCNSCKKRYTVSDFQEDTQRCPRCGTPLTEAPCSSPDAGVLDGGALAGASAPEAVRALDRGDRLGDYVIEGRLGADATGVLYEATGTPHERPVCLKVMDPSVMGDSVFREHFLAQARAAAALEHPNLKRIHEVGTAGGLDFVALEFIEGESLRSYVQNGGPLPFDRVLQIIDQVVGGVRHAVKRGVRHFELRTSNIVLTPAGHVKLGSVGLPSHGDEDFRFFARASRKGLPFYRAPELVREGAEPDQLTAIFSIGCIFYELLAGKPPLRGRTPAEALTRFVDDGVVALQKLRQGLPKACYRLVHKMIEIEPEERPRKLSTVKNLIAEMLAERGLDESSKDLLPRIELEKKKRKEGKRKKGGEGDLRSAICDLRSSETSAEPRNIRESKTENRESSGVPLPPDEVAPVRGREKDKGRQDRKKTGKWARAEADGTIKTVRVARDRPGLRARPGWLIPAVAAGVVLLVLGIGIAIGASTGSRPDAAAKSGTTAARCRGCSGTGGTTVECRTCSGKGTVACWREEPALRCRGGKIQSRSAGGWLPALDDCPRCASSPTRGTTACDHCLGRGVRKVPCMKCEATGREEASPG